MQMAENNRQEFRIYRANKKNTGTATKWQLSFKKDKKYDNWEMFLVGANQTGMTEDGNATFDWEKPIIVKLGINDLGEMIAVLERRKDYVGQEGTLFHQTPGGGNKVVGFGLVDQGYGLKISAQDKDKNKSEVRQVIGFGEAAVLLILLKRAVERIYGW
jgi:hypothetical protein